jgi:hypothetical protein
VRDVTEKMDMLGTSGSCGAPNFRQVRSGLPVFGMGQPSLSGFRRVLQKLQKDGHKVSMLLSRPDPKGGRRSEEEQPQRLWRDLTVSRGGWVVAWTRSCQTLITRVVSVVGKRLLRCLTWTWESKVEAPYLSQSESFRGSKGCDRAMRGASS